MQGLIGTVEASLDTMDLQSSVMGDFFSREMTYYFVAIGLLAILGFLLLRRSLAALEEKRRRRLARTDSNDLLASHINRDVDVSDVKKESIESLQKRFSITRRALYFGLFALAIAFLLFPVVRHISPVLLSAIVACVSVIVGMAARPFIENLICGLVLCFGRLARIGDVVLVDDEYGTIEDVTLTHCVVRRWDWLRYVIPNSTMMTKEFVNYSLRDNHRWVHVEFWVDYRADMQLVEEIAKAAPSTSPYFSGNEAPCFWVVEMAPETVKCMIVAWATNAADGWMLSIDIRKNLLLEFQKHQIETHVRNIDIKDVPESVARA